MPRARIQVQLFLDGRAAWRTEAEIDRAFARRMTEAELKLIASEAVETVKAAASKSPRVLEVASAKLDPTPVKRPDLPGSRAKRRS